MIHHTHRTRVLASASLLFSVLAFGASPALAQEAGPAPGEGAGEAPGPSPFDAIPWVVGPQKGALGDVAEVDVPAEYVFTGASGTQQLMKLMQNPTSGTELGILRPKEGSWFVLFEFDATGYVKDEDKDELDADAMLASLREGNEASNEERRANNWGTLEIVGWEQPPRYDATSQNLEWALKAKDSEGHFVVNYNTRLLGREGVMKVALVCGPEELAAILPRFRTLLAGYGFTTGHRYAEWVAGDKVAEYGLAALVTGSGLAVAAKAGLFTKLGKGAFKLLAVAGVAIAGFMKKIFGKKTEA